jgi:hypothetical protein
MSDGLHVKLGALIYASNEVPESHLFFKGEPSGYLGVSGSVFGGEESELPRLEIRPQTIREEATVYAVFAIE